MLRHIVAIASLLVAAHAAAEPTALSGDAIRETVAGAVFEVDTPLGLKLPVRYSHDGRLSGEAGGLAFVLGSQSDTGKWWIAADRLCQRWTQWFDGAIHCVRLSQDGSRIYWRRDDGETGTASITARALPAVRTAGVSDQPRVRDMPATTAPYASSMAGAAALPRLVAPKPARAAAIPEQPAAVEAAPKRQPAAPKKAETKPQPVKPASATPQETPRADAPKATSWVQTVRPASARPALTYRVAGVDPYDVLNVRLGPSAEHTAIGALLPDARGITIVGRCLPSWCLVSHRGVSGWVNRAYLVEDIALSGSQRLERNASPRDRQ